MNENAFFFNLEIFTSCYEIAFGITPAPRFKYFGEVFTSCYEIAFGITPAPRFKYFGKVPYWFKAGLGIEMIDLPDSLVAITGSSRKNLRKLLSVIQSQNEEERNDDDAY